MCSTPRPKTTVKAKRVPSGTLLSGMSALTRSRFAQRANAAQERRHQIAMKARQTRLHHDSAQKSTKKVVSHSTNKSSPNIIYWLFNASMKEIFMMVFFGHSKRA